MYRGRSRSRSRYGRRNVARQQGFKTYSSRVGGGFVQPRVTRAPRLERAKFLDLNWSGGSADLNYYSATPLVASMQDDSLVPATQLTINKRALNLVINGAGNNDRTSARIMMKSIILRGTLYYDLLRDNTGVAIPMGANFTDPTGAAKAVTVAALDRSVTVFIFYFPRLVMPEYPPWNALLEQPVSTAAGLDEVNTTGARCLLRKTFRLRVNPVAGTQAAPVYGLSGSSRRDFAWKLNLNLPAEWNNNLGGSPALAGMRSGQLLLMYLSNVEANATGLGNNALNSGFPKMAVRCRLAFVDA